MIIDREPTQEQIKEFWEWCGFKYKHEEIVDASATKVFITSLWLNGVEEVEPEVDLNNLFKYAAPRMWILNIALLDGIFWSVTASCPDVHGIGKHGNGKALNENPALALFWAIWEVIKE